MHEGADRLLTRTFALACAMQFTGSLAGTLYILFPLVVRARGGSELLIGTYAGLGAAAAVAARVPVGRLLDRVGRKQIMTVAGLLHAAASLGFLAVGELGLLSAVLVALTSAAGGVMFTSYVTYASDIIPISRRAQGFAWFGIWGMLTNGLGPLLGEWLQRGYGFPAYFATSAASALCATLIVQFLPEHHRATPAAASPPGHRPTAGNKFHLLLGTTFLFGAAECSIFTFLAPFAATERHTTVGPVFMIYACTAVAVRVFTSHLPDRVGRTRMLSFAFFLYAAALFSVPRVEGLWGWIVVGTLGGAGHGYAFPILSALVVDGAGATRGRAVSWFTAMFDLGHMLSNPALGAIAEGAGYAVMYTVIGGFTAAAAAVTGKALGNSAARDDP